MLKAKVRYEDNGRTLIVDVWRKGLLVYTLKRWYDSPLQSNYYTRSYVKAAKKQARKMEL